MAIQKIQELNMDEQIFYLMDTAFESTVSTPPNAITAMNIISNRADVINDEKVFLRPYDMYQYISR